MQVDGGVPDLRAASAAASNPDAIVVTTQALVSAERDMSIIAANSMIPTPSADFAGRRCRRLLSGLPFPGCGRLTNPKVSREKLVSGCELRMFRAGGGPSAKS